jgi:hypothetical protein
MRRPQRAESQPVETRSTSGRSSTLDGLSNGVGIHNDHCSTDGLHHADSRAARGQSPRRRAGRYAEQQGDRTLVGQRLQLRLKGCRARDK